MISVPSDYALGDARYPVLYLLSAGDDFHHTTGTLYVLVRAERVPSMIVVGVPNTNRTRRAAEPAKLLTSNTDSTHMPASAELPEKPCSLSGGMKVVDNTFWST